MTVSLSRAMLAAAGLVVASAAFGQAAPSPAVDPSPAASQAADAPSQAEQLLFLHPHLTTARPPHTLTYDYVAELAAAPRTTDRAVLTFEPGANGSCCSTHAEYLSGPMRVQLPDIDNAGANPILLYFLEGEVRLLERLTKGQSAHFRRRIRQALVDEAKVTDITVRWGGKDVAAQQVRVAPFINDPFRPRFQSDSTTEYTFVLSDAVPGGVYSMSAVLPGVKAGDAPLSQRRLVLADPQPAADSRK